MLRSNLRSFSSNEKALILSATLTKMAVCQRVELCELISKFYGLAIRCITILPTHQKLEEEMRFELMEHSHTRHLSKMLQSTTLPLFLIFICMAGSVRFELTKPLDLTVQQTADLNHSSNFPNNKKIKKALFSLSAFFIVQKIISYSLIPTKSTLPFILDELEELLELKNTLNI